MDSAGDVVAEFERRIADGVLRPGDRVPPVRTLAEQVGLAPNTVAAAYRTLGQRGILVGRGRAGTFVAGRPPLAMPSGPVVPAGVTDLGTGNPDAALLPDPARYFPQPGTRQVLYGERALEPDLEARGREALGSDGIEAQALVAVSGALDGIERILGAHLRPGDRIAVEDPAYASVLDLVGALGLTPVPIPVDDEGLDAAEAESVLSDGVAALIVTPRAHNPTGAATSAARAERLRAALDRAPDVLVIEDDHAGRVAGAPINSIIDPARERWAFVRSVAKGYGPDLRLALVAGDTATLRRLEGRQQLGPGWVSHYLQRAVAAMLGDHEVAAKLDRASLAYGHRRSRLLGLLREVGIPAHGVSGLNVWVPVQDEATVVAAMIDRGFAVRSGARFRVRSGPGVRITVASASDGQLDAVAGALIEVLGLHGETRSG